MMMLQEAQLRPIAQRALAQHNLADATLTPVNVAHNAVYEVQQGDFHAVLRVYAPRPRVEIDSELAWLRAIAAETTLTVTIPLSAVYADTQGDKPVYAVLLRWVEGQSIAPEHIQPHHAHATGKAIATLHNHAQTFSPPSWFTRPTLDWEGLFGERSPYASDMESELFTAEQRQIMQEVADQVRSMVNVKGTDGLIHGDLIAKNILFDRDWVALIDFDNCAYGYFLYDLAPFLWGVRQQPHYAALKEALWAGYTTERPSGDMAQLEAFVAARHIASCRWVAGSTYLPAIRDRAPQIIAERVDEMRRYLATGIMGRQGSA